MDVKEKRVETTENIEKFWEPDGLRVVAKVAYYSTTLRKPVFRMFKSEFEKGGRYLELMNMEGELVDREITAISDTADRTQAIAKYNAKNCRSLYYMDKVVNFREKYREVGPDSFEVPLEDLSFVRGDREIKVQLESDEKKDDNIDRLTMRDAYAIFWNKPVSEKKWLNDLIKENPRKEKE